MPEYKLSYFPLRARAEAIRLIFHYKSIPFEDVRIPREEWPAKKNSKLFCATPSLYSPHTFQLSNSDKCPSWKLTESKLLTVGASSVIWPKNTVSVLY
jgi:hypothetical protein